MNRTFLSPYDSSVDYTPNFQRFAKEGLVFERHQTESGQSGTAFASIFSGRQVDGHGIYNHPRRLSADLELVGERFAAAGFETHSWLDHPMANASLGYAQGIPKSRQHATRLTAEDPAFVDLLDGLQADADARAFIVTNFTVTHAPYRGFELPSFCRRFPKRCEVRDRPDFAVLRELYADRHIAMAWGFEAVAEELGFTEGQRQTLEEITDMLYRADTARLDSLFGAVIAALETRGLLDESLIAFTSDHGEIRVRDNARFRWTHGMQLAPEVLNVPLIVRGPGPPDYNSPLGRHTLLAGFSLGRGATARTRFRAPISR